ncbi:MAG: Rpn family recombination-promoting nuclease/putative transposase, partial [Rhodocyclaceae bacterium]|nr:Rpn family recombination-promoting nuclease/putative transposase [Rhodocyclaceae bacterium]
LLPEKHQIQDLQYTKNEQQGTTILDRKAIFDLNCISPTGERFIVELQRAKHNYFKDRSLYYATFPIQEQAQRGEWDFKLTPVYFVGILDFVFEEDRDNQEVVHVVQLKNKNGKVFYDKLTFIYLTLPHFKKTLEELQSDQDKWFYIFRHLQELQEIPSVLQGQVFHKLFETAQLACFNAKERHAYDASIRNYRDWKGITEAARDEGREEGLEKGLEKGREEGREEGREKGREEGLNTASLRLIASGMSEVDARRILGLS